VKIFLKLFTIDLHAQNIIFMLSLFSGFCIGEAYSIYTGTEEVEMLMPIFN